MILLLLIIDIVTFLIGIIKVTLGIDFINWFFFDIPYQCNNAYKEKRTKETTIGMTLVIISGTCLALFCII